MNLIQTIIMGIVQGLSEFLPISSSAHLVFSSNFYKIFKDIPIQEQSTQEVFLDIMLHLGTLIAVLIFFRKEVLQICKALLVSVKTKDFSSADSKLGLYIIAGTVVTIVLALPLHDAAEMLVFHPSIVGGLLILTGGVLFYSEYMSKKREKSNENMNWFKAVLIGLAQGLAVLPGFSRSGWTIATGLFTGLKREVAARYSFLLSIPIILGASMVYPLVKLDLAQVINYDWGAIICGTLVSAIVGYICIKYFMKFISKFSLNIFAIYCILMGIFSMIFFVWKGI